MKYSMPNEDGFYGNYGGCYVPETLMGPVLELKNSFTHALKDSEFIDSFHKYLKNYVGRPTALTKASNLTRKLGGAKIYLKREDLNHTGAHKINNCIGQILLAQRMGKKRIIAETGAGQHGVATATVAAKFGMKCTIYMGAEDVKRQKQNVYRMKLLGAEVKAVEKGSHTLKDAINEALRDWVSNIDESYYLIGSALGPHPYPEMVRTFQSIIGREVASQIKEREGRDPDLLIACIGGGSNAIGFFHEFLNTKTRMIGVEAGGKGLNSKLHASRFNGGSLGVFQGSRTYLLQDENGQIEKTHSVSAGLDYAAIGPEHAHLRHLDRVIYTSVSDKEALEAFHLLCQTEGIIPALESSHAIAEAIKIAPQMKSEEILIVNLSGRGDKDMETIFKYSEKNYE